MDKAKELAELYVRELKWYARAPEAIVSRAEREFKSMLINGYPSDAIETAIRQYKKSHQTEKELSGLIRISQIFDEMPTPESSVQLIEEGRFYYHPRLQIRPGAPVMTIDDDGNFVRLDDEKIFLEMVYSFTMKDLCDYFYAKTKQDRPYYKRDAGGFEYILNDITIDEPYNSLDLVLFTIDEAVALAYDTDHSLPKQAIDINNYISDGFKLYEARYSNYGGPDHVIARE